MIQRYLKLPKNKSFFLFGARGTGKTSLLDMTFNSEVPRFNLLKPDLFREFQKRPESLISRLPKHRKPNDWVVIDEIQRVPELLNLVHLLMEEEKLRFALTGSSARKLRRSGANLLGGRAILQSLFPFTARELGERFDLDHVLQWGSLPIHLEAQSDEERGQILNAYVDTFIREEIREEQVIRKLDPFLRFLEVAAQMDGKVLNASSIARDTQAEPRTILRYYEVLEDTLLGFHLDSYNRSLRRAQRVAPKFYFFDTGVSRALSGLTGVEVRQSSKEYGNLFESFFINEVYRLNEYHSRKYQMSYLRTKDGLEIDLILEKPRERPILIEIKSSDRIDPTSFEKFKRLKSDVGAKEFWIASRQTNASHTNIVEALFWQEVLNRLF